MKKQFLLLTICLSLSTSFALAQCQQCKNAMPVPTQNTMKMPLSEKEARKVPTRDEMKKRFEQRRTQEREQMYNELGMTQEQKLKAEALDAKTKLEAAPLVKKAKMEHKKLKDMIAKHEPYLAIRKQKQITRAAKKEVYSYFKNSKAAFEAILTKDQVIKLKALHKEKIKKMEEMRKNNPQCKCRMKKMPPCHCKHMKKMWQNPEEFGPFGPEVMGPPPMDAEFNKK